MDQLYSVQVITSFCVYVSRVWFPLLIINMLVLAREVRFYCLPARRSYRLVALLSGADCNCYTCFSWFCFHSLFAPLCLSLSLLLLSLFGDVVLSVLNQNVGA